MAVIVTFILTKRRDIYDCDYLAFGKMLSILTKHSNWHFSGKKQVQDKIRNLVYFFPCDKLQLSECIIKAIKLDKPREVKLLRANLTGVYVSRENPALSEFLDGRGNLWETCE